MTTQPTLTKQLSDGRMVTIDVGEYCGQPSIEVRINGKYMPGGFGALSTPIVRDGVTYTHGAARVLLTADEATIVKTAMDHIRTTHPDCIKTALRHERQSLVDALGDAYDAEKARRARAHDRGDMREAVRMDETKIEAARKALAEWDAAHPGYRK